MGGNAVGVALGPQVAVRGYVSGDPSTHVLLWNPATGKVRDLGQGFASGINADGFVVGQTLGGQAAYWSADGALHNLGFAGALNHVNLFGQAVGFALRSGPGNGTTPILIDLRRPTVVTTLKLPTGWPFGIPKDISDSGLIVGDAYRDALALTSEGVLWTSPKKRAVALQNLVRGRGLKGFQLTNLEGVDINGLIVGSVTPRTQGKASASQGGALENAIEMLPDISEKFEDALDLATFFVLREGPFHPGEHLIFDSLLEASHAWRAGDKAGACSELEKAIDAFRRFHFTSASFDGEQLLDFKQQGIESAEELKREIPCP
jgi:hypothetical protein